LISFFRWSVVEQSTDWQPICITLLSLLEHLRVYLLQEMLAKNNNEMRNWSKMATLMIYGNAPPSLTEMHRSHTATKFKITFADYHYHILDQLYRPDETPTETDTPIWARAEMNSVVYSL
jgi:hypothetical protein